jgi:ABC-type transporter Mla subunit MlaD
MESWQTAVVVLVAVLAGALLPALVQLSLTLKTSRTVLEETSEKLGRTLDAVTATAERLDRITAGLERTVDQVRESVRIASAVGAAVAPTVGAAVKAWRAGAEPAPAAAPGDGALPGGEGKEELR